MIYFWSLYFGQPLMIPEGTKLPTSFAATSGGSAIVKCFTAPGMTS